MLEEVDEFKKMIYMCVCRKVMKRCLKNEQDLEREDVENENIKSL